MSLARGKPCRCAGSNANCFLCFGTGVVETPEPTPLRANSTTPARIAGSSFVIPPGAETAPRPRGVFTAGPKKPMVLCPVCKGPVSRARLEKHLAKVHQPSETGASGRAVPRPPAPPKQASAPKPPASRTPQRRPSGVPKALCAVCGLRFDAEALALHLRTKHPSAPMARRHPPATGPGKEPKRDARRITAAPKADTTGEYESERRLDRGRHFFQIRDFGKFGSFPVHDDFDDESQP